MNDPEIRRPITELGMVDSVNIDPQGMVAVHVLLTVSGCPLKDTITRDVTAAVGKVPGVTGVDLTLGVMSPEQRSGLQETLRGGQTQREIPFGRPDSLTKVYAIASGKGGVGKSSVTVNLAVAMALQGRKVGIVDADIYGHSVPAMLGVGDVRPTQVEEMIMPVPVELGALGVAGSGDGSGDVGGLTSTGGTGGAAGSATGALSVISIGMLKPRRDQVVAWRGPMLDRALVQMLSDVYWGDLDVLFLDLPPGTGDIAISLGQHLPNAEVVVVTTPQEAAAEVAERAGTMASMMHQRVVGVVENMSFLPCPHCGPEHRLEVFGSGGGARVAATLSARFGYDVPVLGEIPLDLDLRSGGDVGRPIISATPGSVAAGVLGEVADKLAGRGRGLAGMQLGLSPAGRL
ncbi:Mrp/NBP35 family ATP-binding protein [Nocardioides mesophilus]|uniref:Mrp/NBP35 family ATP-binding protein n=1 Tax=Nocardioides mesophilus TaxID=433659 RepID=UPI001FED1D17|nr:P-loop NTPase [Nocardioides mesophilus]